MALPIYGDYAAEQGEIERRRKYAEALRDQSMQPLETQTAGGWAIPNAPTQYLAKALQAYSGKKGISGAKEEQAALQQRARTEASDFVRNIPQPVTRDLNTIANDDEGNPNPPAMQTTSPEEMRRKLQAHYLSGAMSGNPLIAPMAGPMVAQALKQDDPYTLGEGQRRFQGNQEVAAGGPKTFAPPAPVRPLAAQLPGRTRELQVGDQSVTQELQADGTWKEIGRGPKFAKQVGATTINAAPVTPVTIQDPKNQNATIIVDGRTGRQIGVGPKMTEAGKLDTKRQFNMQGIGQTISEAERLLSGEETGTQPTQSGAGAAADYLGRLVGKSPKGAKEATALEAVGGALTAKMPRMEGPQSDKDTMMYREMAGKVSDRTVPIAERQLALSKVKELWAKYERLNPDAFAAAPQPAGDAGVRRYNPATGRIE